MKKSKKPDLLIKGIQLMVPEEGQVITVVLPSEITRAKVVQVHDDDHITAELIQVLMGKTHRYSKDDKVKFKRVAGLSGEFWGAMK